MTRLIVDPSFENELHSAAVSSDATHLMGVDPGSSLSAYTVIERSTRRPIIFGKVPNADLLKLISDFDAAASWGTYNPSLLAVEMVITNGMPARAEVFDACVQIGRVQERWDSFFAPSVRISVSEVRAHLCGGHRGAKDQNVRIALLDRFAYGVRNYGKGTKSDPGWFYGFAADVWQSYAIAVAFADELEQRGWVPKSTKRCWCGAPVGLRNPGDGDGLGCLGDIWHEWEQAGAALEVVR